MGLPWTSGSKVLSWLELVGCWLRQGAGRWPGSQPAWASPATQSWACFLVSWALAHSFVELAGEHPVPGPLWDSGK